MQIVLITGMSGSGRSVALNVPENADYYCVDNLSVQFIPELTRYLVDQGYAYLDVTTDIRSCGSLHEVPETVTTPRKKHNVHMLFLTASTTALVQRCLETHRRHSLPIRNSRPDTAANAQVATKGLGTSPIEVIEIERELLSPLADPAYRVDASMLHTSVLHAYIKEFISDEPYDITLVFESFDFKHGMPTSADLVLDVRSLSNPYYDTQLHPLTGRDQPVIDFLQSQPIVPAMAEDIRTYMEKQLPSLIADSRSCLAVAIGCTGGQHRPAYIVERLATYLRAHGDMLVRHHELAVDG